MKYVIEIPLHEVATSSKEEVIGVLEAVIHQIKLQHDQVFWGYELKEDAKSDELHVSYGIVREAL